jgi:signal transduction histidine kinase
VSADLHTSAALPTGSPVEVEVAIAEFSHVLEELHVAHAELADRAARMEQELAANVAELEAVLNGLPTGVVVRDADHAVRRANPVAQELLGEDESVLRGRTEVPVLDRLVADGTARPLSSDRSDQRLVALRRSPVTLSDGSAAGSVEILDDRTELEAMAQRVTQQDKMAALGTMAGGIAHEIRNPLNAVRGFASLLAARVPEDGCEARWARLIEEGVDECDAIVGAVLAFAAPERLCIERLNARVLCESAIGVVQRELARTGRDSEYTLSLCAPDDLAFDGDRIQMRQALRNLIANAVDVQPSGGLVRVEVTTAGTEIKFRVHDAGPGIPTDLAPRIAEPFFTTRADGTGLGLALVHTVARLHGGSLKVPQTPGPLGGADMHLVLPIEALRPSTSAGIPSAPSDPR